MKNQINILIGSDNSTVARLLKSMLEIDSTKRMDADEVIAEASSIVNGNMQD